MTEIALVADGVTRSRSRGGDRVVALPPLSVTLDAGEFVVVVGASLSGKTTLVELLAGWDEPDAGSIAWPTCSASPPTWDELRVIPQELALVEELTVEENVTLADRVARGNDSDASAEALFESLDLNRLRNRSVGEISIGERQRVMVARALVGSPRIVLADEPTAHQDRVHGSAVLSALRTLTERGSAVLMATRHEDLAGSGARVQRLWHAG